MEAVLVIRDAEPQGPTILKNTTVILIRYPDPPILAFLAKKIEDPPKKARIFLFAEESKNAQKSKAHRKTKKARKTKKKNKDWKVRVR